MRGQIFFPHALGLMVAAALAVPACSKPEPPQQTYTLVGQVMSVDAPQKMVTVKHDEIKGFMGAMTMPYQVRDPKLLDGLSPGDLINGTLIVESNGAYLSTIKKTGQAPVPKPPGAGDAPPSSAS
ncbi:MAG TPA: copper-binding protein, partial [Vicinamibacterales bacterium]|nr:copper-binding protein [Vicinamibacterales bacterium]